MNIDQVSLEFINTVSDKSTIKERIKSIKNLSGSWVLISPKGVEFDLNHLEFNLDQMEKDENLHTDLIYLDPLEISDQVNKECNFYYEPIYGHRKLGLTLNGFLISSYLFRAMLNTLLCIYEPNGTYPKVSWAMLAPIAFNLLKSMDRGILLTQTEFEGKFEEMELTDQDKNLVSAYIETLIPTQMNRFFEEFKYAVK